MGKQFCAITFVLDCISMCRLICHYKHDYWEQACNFIPNYKQNKYYLILYSILFGAKYNKHEECTGIEKDSSYHRMDK